MSMSDHERSLLLTGTLDTSGVGGSPFADLDNVALAFGAPVASEAPVEEAEAPEAPGAEVQVSENAPQKPVAGPVPEPVAAEETKAEPVKAEGSPPARKRTATKKPQAPAPADS
jgi:hypothetical protein